MPNKWELTEIWHYIVDTAKTCDTAVTGHGVAEGTEFMHRTCTC
jgi:hypothetical protein